MPADLDLYDYDSYDEVADEEEATAPRWPWVIGVAAIVAAIALVVSVSLLFARTDTNKLATPSTAPDVDPADAGRDHRHNTAARAASAADQRGTAPASAADQ